MKLAVLLSDVPLPWVTELRAIDLPLAGRAARLCLDRLEKAPGGPAQLDALRQALLARSRDAGIDLRLRIEAGEALGAIGDPRYQRVDGPGSSHYLVTKPAHWIDVPGGRHRIGSDDGDGDEQPVTSVKLQTFQIAFAPVTNAEYRCFVEAGGYEDDEWRAEGVARQWRKEGLRNEQSFDQYRAWMQALREDFDQAVAEYFPNAPESTVEGDLRTYAEWTEEEGKKCSKTGSAPRRSASRCFGRTRRSTNRTNRSSASACTKRGRIAAGSARRPAGRRACRPRPSGRRQHAAVAAGAGRGVMPTPNRD